VRASLVNALKEHYLEKGFLDAKVTIKQYSDERSVNATRLEFIIDKGSRVKIKDIRFVGNNNVKYRTLLKKMKETAEKRRLFKISTMVRDQYEEYKINNVNNYYTIGHRGARITKDSIWRNSKGQLKLRLDIEEGRRYDCRHIVWK